MIIVKYSLDFSPKYSLLWGKHSLLKISGRGMRIVNSSPICGASCGFPARKRSMLLLERLIALENSSRFIVRFLLLKYGFEIQVVGINYNLRVKVSGVSNENEVLLEDFRKLTF